jgi:hypothetical protein
MDKWSAGAQEIIEKALLLPIQGFREDPFFITQNLEHRRSVARVVPEVSVIFRIIRACLVLRISIGATDSLAD